MPGGLGIDIAGVEDVDLFLSSADGPTSAAQAVGRSLLHAPGKLWWAPDTGHDVRQYIHGFGDTARIKHNVQAAAEADERVQSADVRVQTSGRELLIVIDLTLISGETATLTVRIDELGRILDSLVLG